MSNPTNTTTTTNITRTMMNNITNECDELASEAFTNNSSTSSGLCHSVIELSSALITPHSVACGSSITSTIESTSYSVAFTLASAVRGTFLSSSRAQSSSSPLQRRSEFDGPDGHIPTIPLDVYLQRFVQHTNGTKETFVTSLIFVDRLISSGVQLTSHNVHRVFAAAFVVASKFVSDKYLSNRHYSKVSGVSIDEMNKLERSLLIRIDHSLFVTESQFASYSHPLEVMSIVSVVFGDLPVFICDVVRELRAKWSASHFALSSSSSSRASSFSSSSSSRSTVSPMEVVV